MDSLPIDHQRRIVTHVAGMRALGLLLGMLPVLVVLGELEAPAIMWALALGNGLVWPWVARQIALSHPQPGAMERRNLYVDSAMGGVWIALMQFNVVPSVALASMLVMDKLAFGGLRLALPSVATLLGATLLIAALNDFAMAPQSSTAAALATVPLLLVYPSAIAYSAYVLSQRVRRKSAALEALSRTDPLTGLANRRAVMAAAEHELRRFRRSGHRASLLVVDIDRFRQLNEQYGAAAGDAALRAVGATLKATLRDTDTVGRLEADTFAAVLTDASGPGVGELAERLRHAVAAAAPAGEAAACPTVSIGYAQLHVGLRDSAQWLAAAEAALRAAKTAGRNRSVSAPALGVQPV